MHDGDGRNLLNLLAHLLDGVVVDDNQANDVFCDIVRPAVVVAARNVGEWNGRRRSTRTYPPGSLPFGKGVSRFSVDLGETGSAKVVSKR